ncbi:uncharacterized protein [Rutidosis leptorrhynchoides]|uniref:uncharacterized protein n=1 Tax=Rutidosis leptorrhynchoides TaxID=125765 RepID=UPI003A997F85
MKLLSYNVRGFGVGKENKFGSTKKLLLRVKPSFVAIQETKLHSVKFSWIQSLWGSSECDFIQQEMVGKFGGQLLIWDTNVFDAIDVIKIDWVIGIRGKWKANETILNVLNVYGPHEDDKKQKLWDSIASLISGSNEAWAICGDFNEVRVEAERFNCEFIAYRAKRFNEFIENNALLDIPLGGRAYTRVSDDGIKFSKLDHFLLSENFYTLWENISAVVLDRLESDHCPIVLMDDDKNFGPKPCKVFDVWLEGAEAEQIVKDAWNEKMAGSRKDRCLMKKLKKVKLALKSWSTQQFGQIDGEIEMYKSTANSLELKAESIKLNTQEMDLWKNSRKKWLEKERIKTSMLKQKARVKWVLEGDENSRFFHSIIRNKNNRCNIRGVLIHGIWNDSPEAIKNEAFKHFSRQF